MKLRAVEVADAVGGRLAGPDVEIDGVSIDSRTIAAGQLFVPVVAERDGHEFIAAALEAGAAAYLTARDAVGATAIVVDDTALALQRLGQAVRARHEARVIGVTGSVGKTTVKDLLAGALAARYRTAASARSHNNELGVPLTLVNAPDGVEAIVVEMGARGRGHIAALCAVAKPSIGVVTRVVAAHTELFGTVDDVAAAKAELVEALPGDGVAVLNAADDRVAAMADKTRARVLLFGAGGDVAAEDVEIDADLRPAFRMCTPWGSTDVRLQVHGAHQVDNALAAGAAALAAGVDVDDVAGGLAAATVSPWRMDLARLPSGARLLNDAYNANPASTRVALEALAALPAQRRVAVLGVMAELGARSGAEHAAVAELAGSLGIDLVPYDTDLYGGSPVTTVDEAVERIGRLGEADAVLVKASRVAGLEHLAARLADAD